MDKDNLSKTTALDLDKIRNEQLRKSALHQNDPELFQKEIDDKLKKREEAKKAILKKINDGTINTEIKSTTKVTLDSKPSIKVIKNDFAPAPENQIKETRDKLSYTLQMDTITKNQVSSYRNQKNAKQVIDVEAKLSVLDPIITMYYTIICVVLLIVSTILIYTLY
ncbi:MAG: hypothetical protein RR543_04385 [Erysipelotrichales bacterium]